MLSSLAAGIAVPLLLILWSAEGRLRRSPWPGIVAIVWYGLRLARDAAANVRAPREWDYACFWLYGHIAAAHQNVYDPAVFAHFPSPFTPSDGFRAAVLDVGFPYPPPSIGLFVPFAFIHGVSTGLAVWYCVQFAALAGAAWLLARAFMPADGWRSACLVLALIVALPASLMNVADAQTNFLLLLLVALALHGRRSAAGAVWQTLAIWVKPYTAVLLLLDILRGRARRLIVAGITALASLLAAAVVLGPATFAAYLHADPAAREPSFAFAEVVNQSLLAIVLRLHAVLPPHVSIFHEPLYLAGTALLTALTLALCTRTRTRRGGELEFALLLLLGLLVYPGSLSSYGVVLIVPLLVVWRHRAGLPGGARAAALLVGLAVILQSAVLQRGFEANALIWIACAYLLLRERSEPRIAPLPSLRPAAARPVEIAR